MLLQTPICDFGWKAPDFVLKDPDGQVMSLEQIRGDKGTLIAFICNHCPYVKAVIAQLVGDVKILQEAGIGVAAVMSNDFHSYPEDSPQNMKIFAAENGFTFPYLLDEDQSVARQYDAVCTPDFFGFDAELGLQYRGRLDASTARVVPGARRELREAMLAVAKTGKGPEAQTASMGCSIKWK
ncbi:thioredoxin family protein [Kiloniella laminariae]|uniref:Thioredoxin family protein n=2 Tax=Kiloniella laminariae TaxID=454162 RepID=A0ABT4LJE0_9PROT|nr:thioredoxin family protein [Kiloniella laminariae]MCZ4281192.1 thioredoxin family protein [Kiloniella laminariae]